MEEYQSDVSVFVATQYTYLGLSSN